MNARLPGDQATVSVLVKLAPDETFRLFTDEIDQWWRSGRKFRKGERGRSVVHLEQGVGGRLFESFESDTGPVLVETGRVTLWEPPLRLVLEWRAANFTKDEKTEVEVLFAPTASGTSVTVHHRGFASLPKDHPVRHGADAPRFIAAMGMWWADLLSSLREHAALRVNTDERAE